MRLLCMLVLMSCDFSLGYPVPVGKCLFALVQFGRLIYVDAFAPPLLTAQLTLFTTVLVNAIASQ